ncbi:MAG: NAD-dependent epimerase/dehydratase family protein [bacterium]
MNIAFNEEDAKEIVKNSKKEIYEFEGKTILITGGLGFLGQMFIRIAKILNESLFTSPCKVISIDNLITSSKSLMNHFNYDFVEFLEHDVVQEIAINQEVNFIVHAAGIASPTYYRKYPLETLDVAIQGTRNMLNLAKEQGAKLLYFSSSEIYGDPYDDNVPTPETFRGNVSSLGPRACYDESKRLGETISRIYYEQFGVHSVIVRPFNVFGPGMNKSDYRVLPNFARQIISGNTLKVYGTGSQTRTYCYITDAVTGFIKALLNGKPGEAYNIGNDSPEISVIELTKYISRIIEEEVKVELSAYPSSYPPDEPQRRCPDLTKSKNDLSFNPTVELERGLQKFFEWAKIAYK